MEKGGTDGEQITAAKGLGARAVPPSYTLAVPKKNKPDRHFNVGDTIKVNLHTGRIVDATIKAIIENTDGVQLQVDFGHDETALVHEWQIID